MMDRKRRKSAAIRSALRFLIAVSWARSALWQHQVGPNQLVPSRLRRGSGLTSANPRPEQGAEQREAVKGDAGHRSPDDELDALFREFALERESRMKRFQDAIKGKKAVPAAKKDNEYVDRIVRRALEHATSQPRTGTAEKALIYRDAVIRYKLGLDRAELHKAVSVLLDEMAGRERPGKQRGHDTRTRDVPNVQ